MTQDEAIKAIKRANPGISDNEAAEAYLLMKAKRATVGMLEPRPDEAPTFRQRVREGIQYATEPLAGAIDEGLGLLGRAGNRLEQATAGTPEIAQETAERQRLEAAMPPPEGETAGRAITDTLIPPTPEGMALMALPFAGPAARTLGPTMGRMAQKVDPFAGSMGKLLIPPAVGAGTALATGGTLGEAAAGAAMGGAQSAAAGATRYLQELNLRRSRMMTDTRKMGESTDMARNIQDAFSQSFPEMAPALSQGKNPAESLIQAPGAIQKLAGERFQAVETKITDALRGQTVDLPILASIRGRMKTTPATPPVLGPNGQPVAGSPAGQTLDMTFDVEEALGFLKKAASVAREKSKRGELASSFDTREVNRQVDAEFRQALASHPNQSLGQKLAGEFEAESDIYRKAMRARDVLNVMRRAKVFTRDAGTPTEGGVNPQAVRNLLIEATKEGRGKDYLDTLLKDFPDVARTVFQGLPVGAGAIQAQSQRTWPGVSVGVPAGPRFYFGGTPQQQVIPPGGRLRVSGTPSRAFGAAAVPMGQGLLNILPGNAGTAQ